MGTVEFKLSLPEQLLKEAEEAGLLNSESMERLLREEIRRRRADNFLAATDRLAALDLPILSDEEIVQEIRLARRSTAA
jgi:hypothetical protein